MDGGYEQEDEAAEDEAVLVAGNNTDGPNTVVPTCSACGEAGHKMRTSKKCRYYKQRGSTTKQGAVPDSIILQGDAEDIRDAEEQDLMDAVAFDCSDDDFFDAHEEEDDFDTSFLICIGVSSSIYHNICKQTII